MTMKFVKAKSVHSMRETPIGSKGVFQTTESYACIGYNFKNYDEWDNPSVTLSIGSQEIVSKILKFKECDCNETSQQFEIQDLLDLKAFCDFAIKKLEKKALK